MTEAVAPVPTQGAEPTAPAPVPAPNLHKVKIDGVEMDIPYEELVRDYQTRKASDKAFREGAEARKQAEQLVTLLKKDPLKVLKDPALGLNVRQLAEEYLAAEIGDELMDPKDRELRDLKRWKEAQEAERLAEEEEAKNSQQEELKARYMEDYSKAIVEVLDAGGLPKTPYTVKRMAYYMHEGLKRNMDLTPKDIASLVREDYVNEHKAIYSSLEGDSLLSLFGEETAAKIRKHDLSRLKQSGAINNQSKAPRIPNRTAAESDAKKITKDEWRERMKQYTKG